MSEDLELRQHVLRTSRRVSVSVCGDVDRATSAWWLLHGYGQRADAFLAELAPVLARPDRLLVAPEAPSRFYLRGSGGDVGASWMTKESRDNEILDTLDLLDESWRRWAPHLAPHVFGFSQGGSAAMRWAVLGAVRASAVTLWASDVPSDLDPDLLRRRLDGVPLTWVIGSDDRWLRDARLGEVRERWASLGLPVAEVRFEGPHVVDRAVLESWSTPLP